MRTNVSLSDCHAYRLWFGLVYNNEIKLHFDSNWTILSWERNCCPKRPQTKNMLGHQSRKKNLHQRLLLLLSSYNTENYFLKTQWNLLMNWSIISFNFTILISKFRNIRGKPTTSPIFLLKRLKECLGTSVTISNTMTLWFIAENDLFNKKICNKLERLY